LEKLKYPIGLCLALIAIPQAHACGITPSLALIHSDLPLRIPTGMFIASVEIKDHKADNLYDRGLRATVRQVIRGEARIREIILRNPIWSSCDRPFANGRSGYVVGVPHGMRKGRLVVEAILVSRWDGFRLMPNAFDPPLPVENPEPGSRLASP
jgi:hypothetical protein